MKKLILFFLIVSLFVSGCAMSRHQSHVRAGEFIYRLHRDAFLNEWGPPDRVTNTEDAEFINFPCGAQNIYYPKRKMPLEVLIYRKYGTALIFRGNRLMGWKSDKTPAELAATQHKP